MIKQLTAMAAIVSVLLTGCACSPGQNTQPPSVTSLSSTSKSPAPSAPAPSPSDAVPKFSLPEQITLDSGGIPFVKVYVVQSQSIEEMDVETYLQGVLAGEMKNDWPMEALKAQAILARSFFVQFMKDKDGSRYEGADVSTDIEEAQAYDAAGIDENIRRAIEETRGEILVHQGEPIYAWFHSHSGGVTAMAKEGLGYEKDEPPYIRSVQVSESAKAHKEAVSWEASFPLSTVQTAIDGFGGGDASQLQIAETGPSGRVTSFRAGGQGSIPAPAFRLALGGTKMRSTFLTELRVKDGNVFMQGKGYGHGVGMSQWAAYDMAEQGMKAEDIVKEFFQDVQVIQAWGKTDQSSGN